MPFYPTRYFGFSFFLSAISLATWIQLLPSTTASRLAANVPVLVMAASATLSALQLAVVGPIVTTVSHFLTECNAPKVEGLKYH